MYVKSLSVGWMWYSKEKVGRCGRGFLREIAEKHRYWKILLTDEQVRSISEATIAITKGEIETARNMMVNAFPIYVTGKKTLNLIGYNILYEMITGRLKS